MQFGGTVSPIKTVFQGGRGGRGALLDGEARAAIRRFVVSEV
jgi:hypothetical protein